MKQMVEGKRVAVIGRAGSLLRSRYGAEIDQADVVIRINWVLPIPEEQTKHVGTKTDIVYHCKRAKTARLTATRLGVKTLRCRGRRGAARRHFRKPQRFRPTTGFMAVLAALTAGALTVHVYGFDFFRSGHVQDREPDGDDYSRPLAWAHSPTQERYAMQELIRKNPGRLFPDGILSQAVGK